MLLCPSFMKSLGSLSDGDISCCCFFTHEFMILPFELQGRIRTVGICGQQELEPGSGSAIQGRKPTVYKLFLNVGAFPYEFVIQKSWSWEQLENVAAQVSFSCLPRLCFE